LNGGSTVNTFQPKPHEVKLYLLQQLRASQTGNAIGFRQLLCVT